jgi:Fe-Mn family superoxide dismutase
MKTSRRNFIQNSLKASAIASFGSPMILHADLADSRLSGGASHTAAPLTFKQVTLPYATNALEPNIDATTMEIHYGKHHTGYIKNVNEAIVEEKISYDSEKDFFANISKVSTKARNNGGGAWNHNFFWQVMRPTGGGPPPGKLRDAINGSFGSFEKFNEQFSTAGMTRFGSGWAWLVADGTKMKIGSTPNQDNPMMDVSDFKGKPLLAIDVWEHAYYLKYQNKRAEYITNWWNVVNWDTVAGRL